MGANLTIDNLKTLVLSACFCWREVDLLLLLWSYCSKIFRKEMVLRIRCVWLWTNYDTAWTITAFWKTLVLIFLHAFAKVLLSIYAIICFNLHIQNIKEWISVWALAVKTKTVFCAILADITVLTLAFVRFAVGNYAYCEPLFIFKRIRWSWPFFILYWSPHI